MCVYLNDYEYFHYKSIRHGCILLSQGGNKDSTGVTEQVRTGMTQNEALERLVYAYVFLCVYMYVYVYIYIYVYRYR